jgi:hypothetical protein
MGELDLNSAFPYVDELNPDNPLSCVGELDPSTDMAQSSSCVVPQNCVSSMSARRQAVGLVSKVHTPRDLGVSAQSSLSLTRLIISACHSHHGCIVLIPSPGNQYCLVRMKMMPGFNNLLLLFGYSAPGLKFLSSFTPPSHSLKVSGVSTTSSLISTSSLQPPSLPLRSLLHRAFGSF